MRTIYTAIQERLKPLLEDKTLRWIDWDKGQLRQVGAKERPPLAYPCALISMGISSATDETYQVQSCNTNITIKLVFDTLGIARTAANAPQAVQDKGLEPYDVITKVYSSLQGFSTDNFNPLSRTSQAEESHNSLFVYRINFKTEFMDESAEE